MPKMKPLEPQPNLLGGSIGSARAGTYHASSNGLVYARTFPTRVDGVHANGLNKWDGNIQRDFRLTEWLQFQARVDFINLLNHTQFSPPGSNPLASDFGQVTTNSATVKRFVLFQGKFRF